MLKQILAGGFWTAMKAPRAALHSFPSAAHTPSCHSRIVSTRDMARWERRFAPLLVLPTVLLKALSSSLLPVLLPSLLPVLQTWQEVASLTSVKQPRDGEVGQRLPQPRRVSTRRCLGLHTSSSLAAAPRLFGFSFSGFFMKSHGFCRLGG